MICFFQLDSEESNSIRSDEGLMLETSVSESLYGGQFTSTQLIKPNYLVILPPTQHHSFFRNFSPFSIGNNIVSCAWPVSSPTISRALLPLTSTADKLPLETEPVVRDNNTIFTLRPVGQTFVAPYSTDNRSIYVLCCMGKSAINVHSYAYLYLLIFIHKLKKIYSVLLYGKQFFGQIGCSDWLIFGPDFTLRTITMETVRLCIFSRSLPGNSKFFLVHC